MNDFPEKESFVIEIDRRVIILSRESIYSALGYPDPEAAFEHVRTKVEELLDETIELTRPKAIVRYGYAGIVEKDTFSIDNGPDFHGKLLARAFRPASMVAVFALTVGEKISERIERLAAEDILRSYLVDVIASEFVESLAGRFQSMLEDNMRQKGLFGGQRFSPGYCDWSIGENRQLLQWLDAGKIGISLTRKDMMIPQKSISGMIGFGPDKSAIHVSPCKACPDGDCQHRRSTAER